MNLKIDNQKNKICTTITLFSLSVFTFAVIINPVYILISTGHFPTFLHSLFQPFWSLPFVLILLCGCFSYLFSKNNNTTKQDKYLKRLTLFFIFSLFVFASYLFSSIGSLFTSFSVFSLILILLYFSFVAFAIIFLISSDLKSILQDKNEEVIVEDSDDNINF